GQGWPEVRVAPPGGPADPSATTGPAVTPAPPRGERTRRDRSPSAGEPPRTSTSTDEGVGDGAGEPEDYPDDEGSAPGRRHDPEADALALLETGLGARRVES
ncbi:MAG: hypothetical protein M3140_04935, partial [Actinomycetota bacterium]|nr:hypothetical protein [Actinomycetota bacterium]